MNYIFHKSYFSFSQYLVIVMLLLCTACHDKVALKKALLEKRLTERIEDHKKKRIAACEKRLIEKAILRADSLMIQAALAQVDTIGQARRPVKPVRPKVIMPVDSIPIEPLFKDLVNEDKDLGK